MIENGSDITKDNNDKKPLKNHDSLGSRIVVELYDWGETLIIALAVVLLTFTFLFRFVKVDGTSMLNTLQHGDALIISNFNYKPKTGDIVVVSAPHYRDDIPLVKRVIATEGQKVDIDFDTWEVYVDDVLLDDEYVYHIPGQRMNDFGNASIYPIIVDEGCIFVMGDNRNGSLDSRSGKIGQLNENYIMGRVMCRVWPFSSGIGRVK